MAKRLTFIAGAATTIVAAPHAAALAIARTEAAPVIPASTINVETWWDLYTTWHPAIQRYPGCLFAPIFRSAEVGNPDAVAYMKGTGLWHEMQTLLTLRRGGEPIYPRSAVYGRPPLTAEELARATKIPPSGRKLRT